MKWFVQYVFKRLVGEYFKSNVGLSNFNISPLRFEKLELNNEAFNKKFLRNSPFLMSSGVLGSVTVSLPSIPKLIEESISIEIKDLIISFEYNELLSYDRWISAKRGSTNESEKSRGEDSEAVKKENIDTLEKIVRKVISNLRIKVHNLVICVAFGMKESSKAPPELIFRLRGADAKKKCETLESSVTNKLVNSSIINDKVLEYELTFSGFSIHMVQDKKFKQELLAGHEVKKHQFSHINHPSTILLCGCEDQEPLKIFFKRTSISNKFVSLSLQIPLIEVTLEPTQLQSLRFFSNSLQKWLRIINDFELRFRQENDEDQVGRSRSCMPTNEASKGDQSYISQMETSSIDLFNFSDPADPFPSQAGEFQYDLVQKLMQRIREQDKKDNSIKPGIIKSLLQDCYNYKNTLKLTELEKSALEKEEKELLSFAFSLKEPEPAQNSDFLFENLRGREAQIISGCFKGLSLILIKKTSVTVLDLLARKWICESSSPSISCVNQYIARSHFQLYVKEVNLEVFSQNMKITVEELKFREAEMVRSSHSEIYESFKEPFENFHENAEFLKERKLEPKMILPKIPAGWHFCLRDIVKIESDNYRSSVNLLNCDEGLRPMTAENSLYCFEGYDKPISNREQEQENDKPDDDKLWSKLITSEEEEEKYQEEVKLIEVCQEQIERSFYAADIRVGRTFSQTKVGIRLKPVYVHFEPTVIETLSDLFQALELANDDNFAPAQNMDNQRGQNESSIFLSFESDGEDEKLRTKYFGSSKLKINVKLECEAVRVALDSYKTFDERSGKNKCFCSYLDIKSRLSSKVMMAHLTNLCLELSSETGYPVFSVEFNTCEGFIFDRDSGNNIHVEQLFSISKCERTQVPKEEASQRSAEGAFPPGPEGLFPREESLLAEDSLVQRQESFVTRAEIIIDKKVRKAHQKQEQPAPLEQSKPLSNVASNFSFIQVDGTTRLTMKDPQGKHRIDSIYKKAPSSAFQGSVSVNLMIPKAELYLNNRSIGLLEKFITTISAELNILKDAKERRAEEQTKILKMLKQVYPVYFFPTEKKAAIPVSRGLQLGVIIADLGVFLHEKDSMSNSEPDSKNRKHKRHFSMVKCNGSLQADEGRLNWDDHQAFSKQTDTKTFVGQFEQAEAQSNMQISFYRNEKFIQEIKRSGIRILCRLLKLAFRTVTSSEKKLSMMAFDLLISDSDQASGQINVPRSLSSGLDMQKVKAKRSEFLQREPDLQKIILYKQAALNNHEQDISEFINSKTNKLTQNRLKRLLSILERDAAFLGNINIEEKGSVLAAEVNLNFKGLALKPDLSFPTVLRLEKLFDLKKNRPEELIIKEKKLAAPASPARKSEKKKDFVFNLVLEDTLLDIFPYFECEDLKKESRISEISEKDFAAGNINYKFYSTTRSIVSVERISAILSKSSSSKENKAQSSLTSSSASVDVNMLKVFFLKYSDFENENHHPLLLQDENDLIASPNSLLLKSLGFVRIMEMQNASMNLKTNQVMSLEKAERKLNANECLEEQMKIKGEGNPSPSSKETEVKIIVGNTGVEFCRDSLYYLEMHILTIGVRVDKFKESLNKNKKLQADLPVESVALDQDEESSLIKQEITDINISGDFELNEENEVLESIKDGEENEKRGSSKELNGLEDENDFEVLVKKNSQEDELNEGEEGWDLVESDSKADKKDFYCAEALEKTHLDHSTRKAFNMSLAVDSVSFRLFDGYDFKFNVQEGTKKKSAGLTQQAELGKKR